MAPDSNFQPAIPHGTICYLEIPSININESASFYNKVFGWKIRNRRDGSVAFDDTVKGMSGTWKLDRKPQADLGLMIYIMVDDVAATLEAVISNGGKVVEPKRGIFPEFIATFSDLSGNIFGIVQQ